jgi:lipopolysaccharide/colanic/teichoic acid biosynthesis glycosyltransferase
MTAVIDGTPRARVAHALVAAWIGRVVIAGGAAAALFSGRPIAAILVTGVFASCLHWSFASGATLLGPAPAAATAAISGLTVTSLTSVWLPVRGLGGRALVATCLAVFLLVVSFEHLVRRRRLALGEHPLGRVLPHRVDADWIAGLPGRSTGRLAKRVFDVVVALLAAVVTAPLWPVIALLVARTSGGVLVHQPRVGEHRRVFTMHKFRTMRHDAEPLGQAVWAEESDPRVTRCGRVLRRTHLDELPQLWNVLKGDMSIVGPRPERPEFVAILEHAVPHWSGRHLVKPGMTGWAQVRQGFAAGVDGSEEKLSYDLWYVRHRSLPLDVAICLSTLPLLVVRSAR